MADKVRGDHDEEKSGCDGKNDKQVRVKADKGADC